MRHPSRAGPEPHGNAGSRLPQGSTDAPPPCASSTASRRQGCAPGESRTIVLKRVQDEASSEDSSAAQRFNRFFNNTPMAIASVDGAGRILRTHQFMKLFTGLNTQDGGDGQPNHGWSRRPEREKLAAALQAAKDFKADTSLWTPPSGRREPLPSLLHQCGDRPGPTRRPKRLRSSYCGRNHPAESAGNPDGADAEMNAVARWPRIAHDFNNVLTAILLSSDLFCCRRRQSDSSFADLMEIKRNANRAAVLVRQLSAFSRKQDAEARRHQSHRCNRRSCACWSRACCRAQCEARDRLRSRSLAGEEPTFPSSNR